MFVQQKFGWGFLLLAICCIGLDGFRANETANLLVNGEINGADTAWMLGASGLVLLMTPGLGFFYAGMVNAKNVVSTLFQSFAAVGVVSIVWLVVGFSLAFGDSIGGLFGNPFTYLMFHHVGASPHSELGKTLPFVLFALFQLKFAIITPALITGAFAERIKFTSYLLFIALWTIIVYSPLAHLTWHPDGIFMKWGILDYAGGTVVHISAGMAALAGALVLGPRNAYKRRETLVPSNVPFVLLGTGLLWFGWFGFNAGSSLKANGEGALAFLNTHMASSVALVVWMCLEGMRGKKVSAVGACIGAVVGLVAITPAAGHVSVVASVIIGLIAATISNVAVHFKERFGFDDTLDVFSCHGLGGIVGMLLTAVFAKNGGLITGETTLFLTHLLGLLITLPAVFLASYLIYKLVNCICPLRITTAEEIEGLDLTQHGELALVPPSAAFPLVEDTPSYASSYL